MQHFWCCIAVQVTKQIVTYKPKKKEGEAYRRKVDGDAFVLSMSAFNHPNVIHGDDSILLCTVIMEKISRFVNDNKEPNICSYRLASVDDGCYVFFWSIPASASWSDPFAHSIISSKAIPIASIENVTE